MTTKRMVVIVEYPSEVEDEDIKEYVTEALRGWGTEMGFLDENPLLDGVTVVQTTKRFLLFNGDDGFHPGGGWRDFVGFYNTIEEAQAACEGGKLLIEWSQVIDCDTWTMVKTGFRKDIQRPNPLEWKDVT